MSLVSIDLHFGPADWQRVQAAWTAWWAGEMDRPLVVVEGLQAPPGLSVPNPHNLGRSIPRFPLETPADDLLDYYQVRLEAKRFYGDAWPQWFPNFGPGIVAGFLGAQVRATPDTVWFEPARRVPIQELQPVFSPDNPWWRRALDLTRRAVARWDAQILVAYTDLGGNLDILASLLGTEQLLMDLCDHPAEVERLVDQITRLWLGYLDELDAVIRPAGRGTSPWATIWSPGRCYMLQSDLAAMISPAMFERFVLPDLIACCQALDHSFYHLDGAGQIAHLDLLLSLEGLDGVQWIPGAGQPPPEDWLPVLRRIREAGKLCQLYVSPQGARKIVRELGGRGFAFYITEPMSAVEAQAFIQALNHDRRP